jgi:hypothetical protein
MRFSYRSLTAAFSLNGSNGASTGQGLRFSLTQFPSSLMLITRSAVHDSCKIFAKDSGAFL